MGNLSRDFSNCFDSSKPQTLTIEQRLAYNARQERKTQLFIRAVTAGVISERDLLLSYTIGEFFNEMSLFIEEQDIKAKAAKKT